MTIDIGTERLRELVDASDKAAKWHRDDERRWRNKAGAATANANEASTAALFQEQIATALRALIAAREAIAAYDEIDEADTSTRATEARNEAVKKLIAIIGSKP